MKRELHELLTLVFDWPPLTVDRRVVASYNTEPFLCWLDGSYDGAIMNPHLDPPMECVSPELEELMLNYRPEVAALILLHQIEMKHERKINESY